jgi:NADP-dependent 3-hydroxy acid dehydrogenase YdfG
VPRVDLSGKVAAVTGASSGIGEATALLLAREGCAVALGARRTERLEALAGRIDGEGGKVLAVETDVTDEASARAFVEGTHERFGRLDILVNNAGVMLLGRVAGADTEEWRRMIHVNLFGVLYCTHAALPIMREQGGGTIVNVSSVAGRSATEGGAVYNLTKFGLGAFSEALRQEAVRDNIRVSLVEPGAVATELSSHNRPEIREAIAKRFGGIRRLDAEDIADAVLYVVAQPDHVAINEVLVRPAGQQR